MSNVFTLDSLREEVDKEFAPVKIGLKNGTEVVLRNILRLGKTDRDKLLEKLDSLKSVEESDAESVDALVAIASDILLLVADQGRQLVKELDGDIALIMKVLSAWMETTQPGEAASSPN